MIFGSYVPTELPYDSPWIIGFNEPDLSFQGNLTPAQAAEKWRDIETNFPDKKLVSPSVIDFQWMVDFRRSYLEQYGRSPRLDAVAVHCYWRDAAGCESLVNLYLSQGWSESVWVTEFQIRGVLEAKKFIDWMNKNPKVGRYAWFTNRLSPSKDIQLWSDPNFNNVLFDFSSGVITDYGAMYKGE